MATSTVTPKRRKRGSAAQIASARKAAAARHSVDTYIASIARKAPELTPEQRDRLAAILRPSDQEAVDA